MKSAIQVLLLLIMVVLQGCAGLGPSYVKKSRGSYIEVIALTDREELLSNLVRLRYSEAPVFMQIDSITASPDLSFRFGAEATIDSSIISTGKLTPSINYAEQPTIVFKPLLGSDFSRKLLLPIKLTPIFILLENGWSLDTVLLPLTRSINNIRNYDQQYSRSANFLSEYRRFTAAVVALGKMQRSGLIKIGTVAHDETPSELVMVLSPQAHQSSEWQLVYQTFGLDAAATTITLSLGLSGNETTLALETRPMLGVMRYMSSFIEEENLQPAIDDRDVHDQLGFHVLSSSEIPQGAIVAIQHRGTWFAIDAADRRSKEVFMMLRILFNLQAQQDSSTSGVALTLPVR